MSNLHKVSLQDNNLGIIDMFIRLHPYNSILLQNYSFVTKWCQIFTIVSSVYVVNHLHMWKIWLNLAPKNAAANITFEILIKSRNCISKYINAIIFPEKN
jgi:hypothetical protein